MTKWTLTNDQYDILKWVISVVIPALIIFLGTVFDAINWSHTDIFMKIAVAFELLLGSIFKLSDSNYNKNKEE